MLQTLAVLSTIQTRCISAGPEEVGGPCRRKWFWATTEKSRMTDDNNTPHFEALGEAVRMRELIFSLVTEDADRHYFAWASLL